MAMTGGSFVFRRVSSLLAVACCALVLGAMLDSLALNVAAFFIACGAFGMGHADFHWIAGKGIGQCRNKGIDLATLVDRIHHRSGIGAQHAALIRHANARDAFTQAVHGARCPAPEGVVLAGTADAADIVMSAIHFGQQLADFLGRVLQVGVQGHHHCAARMLEAGEDPLYVARRLVRFASEDIGNADPRALQLAVAAKDAVHFLGMPEGNTALAQATIYLATAPKSNAVYVAYGAAAKDAAEPSLRKLGAETVDIELPNSALSVPAYYVIAPAEASSNLSRFDGVRYGYRAPEYTDLVDMYKKTRAQGFGAEVKRRILIGTYVLSHGYYDAYYLQAQKIRRKIADDFQRAFGQCDVIAGPVAPTVAWQIGQNANDPVADYLADIYTLPASLAGLPGMSVPAGFGAGGMPVGLQLVGNYFKEGRLLNVAHRLQQVTDAHTRKPQGV